MRITNSFVPKMTADVWAVADAWAVLARNWLRHTVLVCPYTPAVNPRCLNIWYPYFHRIDPDPLDPSSDDD